MTEYQNRPCTVDALLISPSKRVLLIKRDREPFKDCWAIPGGFVELDEDTQTACLRELFEETGLRGEIVGLVGIYDDPNRDPRHSVCICYLVKSDSETITAGDDARQVAWFPLDNLPKLAFDHAQIIRECQKKS